MSVYDRIFYMRSMALRSALVDQIKGLKDRGLKMRDRFSIFITLKLLGISWLIFVVAEIVDEKMGKALFTTLATILLPVAFAYLYVFMDKRNKTADKRKWYRRMLDLILWTIVNLGVGYVIVGLIENGMWFSKQDRSEYEMNGVEYLQYGVYATILFAVMVILVDVFAVMRDRYFGKMKK